MQRLVFFICLIFLLVWDSSGLMAQTGFFSTDPAVWGQIPKEQREMTVYNYEKDAPAVILCDYGVWQPINLEKNAIKLNRHVRIKILKEVGLKWAEQFIAYNNENEEISNLKAHTINYEGKKRKVHSLKLKYLPEVPMEDGRVKKQFFFKEVQVGSIIEYTYTHSMSGWVNLRPWYFQNELPTMWSEIRMQGFQEWGLGYETVNQGGLDIKPSARGKWMLKHVPPLEKEPYAPAYNSCRIGVRFQAVNIRQELEGTKKRWKEFALDLSAHTQFYETDAELDALFALTQIVVRDAVTDEEKIAKIHQHVRDYMEWNGIHGLLINRKPSEIYKSRKGTRIEINLLMLLMLEFAEIKSDKLFIATRDYGKLTQFPLRSQFNDMLVMARADDQRFLLDATDPFRSYDLPPQEALNSYGYIIRDSTSKLVRIPDRYPFYTSIHGNLFIDDPHNLQGEVKARHLGYSALGLRKQLQQQDSAMFWEKYGEPYKTHFSLVGKKIEAVETPGKPLGLTYMIKSDRAIEKKGDTLLVRPLSLWGQNEQPFTTAERKTPIDFGYLLHEEAMVNLMIPENMQVAELPKNRRWVLPNKEITAEFFYQQSEHSIQIRGNLVFKQSVFYFEDYSAIQQIFEKYIQQKMEPIKFIPKS